MSATDVETDPRTKGRNCLIICSGLPASGKTTWAKEWVAVDPAHRARVNKDDLRAMIHDGVYLGADTEERINLARDTLIHALLLARVAVVCDDTNLKADLIKHLIRIGRFTNAEVMTVTFHHVSVEECLRRDALREKPVGEEAIRRLHGELDWTGK